MEWLFDPDIWLGFVTLTALEIVLGVDNLVFVALLSGRLPARQRARARALGVGLALAARLGLLGSIYWIMRLVAPLATVAGHYLTWDENSRGALAPGMAADFVVLGEDPLTCELDRIRHIAVERTFVAGRQVFGEVFS